MSYYKFEQNDIFTNRIKAHPRSYFLINNSRIFYNNDILPVSISPESETILGVPQGHVSLYEINVNRLDEAGAKEPIYPFVTKQGSLASFKTVSTESFQNFQYGDKISGSYPMSASISTEYYATSERPRIAALKNTFNNYKPHSRHYSFETQDWNKATQEIKLVSIPSIFFGSSIKKGSVKMNFYVSGSLVGTLEDKKRNGELIQTLPNDVNVDKVAGVVLYSEGFVALTGSWDLSSTHTTEIYESTPPSPAAPKWTNWGFYGATSSSWDIDFLGTSYIPTMTMFAHAKQRDLNHSNNLTFVNYEDKQNEEVSLRERRWVENPERQIANVVKSPYANHSASFEKTTYISKIGIYDEDKNLIGIAKLATPVKKTESRQYTFKMKIDF